MENVTDRTSNPFDMRPPCERFVPGYGDANADFHVAGDHPDRVTAFAARLDEHRAEIRATETDLDGVATDAETVERLRRLGYRE